MLNKLCLYFNLRPVTEPVVVNKEPPTPARYTDLEIIYNSAASPLEYEIWAVDNSNLGPDEDGKLIRKLDEFPTLLSAQRFIQLHKGLRIL